MHQNFPRKVLVWPEAEGQKQMKLMTASAAEGNGQIQPIKSDKNKVHTMC